MISDDYSHSCTNGVVCRTYTTFLPLPFFSLAPRGGGEIKNDWCVLGPIIILPLVLLGGKMIWSIQIMQLLACASMGRHDNLHFKTN